MIMTLEKLQISVTFNLFTCHFYTITQPNQSGELFLPSDLCHSFTDLAGPSIDVAFAEELLHSMHVLGRVNCG